MRVTVSKKDLSKALGLANPYVKKTRNTLPILNCVSIEASGASKADGITISGTDLETGIKVNVPGIVLDDSGQAVANLSEMKEALKGVKPSDVITLDNDATDFNMFMWVADTKWRIHGMDPSEYPVSFATGRMKSYKMSGDVFRSMLSSVSYAASKEETRYFLNGVYFNLTPESSEFVATDGRRLALSSCQAMPKLTETLSMIIPLVTVKRSLKTFARSETVKFGVNKKNDTLFITDGLATVNSRLVAGEYPKYNEILPKPRSHKVVARVEDLLGATQQMLSVPFSANRMHKEESTVVFDVSRDAIKLSAKSRTTDVKAEAVVPIENGNGNLRIGFDASFIADALKALPSEKVEIEFGPDESHCVVLKPVGVENHLDLIMPRRID